MRSWAPPLSSIVYISIIALSNADITQYDYIKRHKYRAPWSGDVDIETSGNDIVSVKGFVLPISTKDRGNAPEPFGPFTHVGINPVLELYKQRQTNVNNWSKKVKDYTDISNLKEALKELEKINSNEIPLLDRGHILGLSLGGPNVKQNIVPQSKSWQADPGQGWRDFEIEIYNYALKIYGWTDGEYSIDTVSIAPEPAKEKQIFIEIKPGTRDEFGQPVEYTGSIKRQMLRSTEIVVKFTIKKEGRVVWKIKKEGWKICEGLEKCVKDRIIEMIKKQEKKQQKTTKSIDRLYVKSSKVLKSIERKKISKKSGKTKLKKYDQKGGKLEKKLMKSKSRQSKLKKVTK